MTDDRNKILEKMLERLYASLATGPVLNCRPLKARSVVGDALDLHHAGQAHAMEQIIPSYSRATGPSIALPAAEHGASPTLRGAVDMSPRSLLARDIMNLRQYTSAPNSTFQQLIELNKTMYPEAFGP